MKLSASKVLWRDPSKMLANAWVMLPVGLLLSPCAVGFPVAARALNAIAHHVLSNARELVGQPAPEEHAPTFPSWISCAGLTLFGGLMLAFGALAMHVAQGAPALVRLAAELVGASVGVVAIGAVLAPLAFAPILVADGVRGVFAPFSLSFEVAARLGPAASARIGARVGLAFAIPHIVIGVAAYLLSTGTDPMGSVVIAGPLAAWIGTPRALAVLAAGYVETPEPASAREPASGAMRLVGVGWMLAPPLLVLFATVLLASFWPTAMQSGQSEDGVRRGLGPIALSATPRSARLPGTSVTVRTTTHGIFVEAADGGAGPLEAGFDTAHAALRIDQRSDGTGALIPEYRVTVRSDERFAYVIIDSDGLRLDDTVADRTFGRLGGFGSGVLGVGMLLLLFLSFTVGVELGAARTMSAPSLLGGGPKKSTNLAALEGTLRVADGSKVVYTPPGRLSSLLGRGTGRIRVEGEAWIEADGGALRFRLPDDSAEVLGSVAGDAWDGKHVVLLSTFASSGVTGLRTAAAPWPADGRLALGTRADAREVLVARAVKRASRIALPVMVSFGIACAVVLLRL